MDLHSHLVPAVDDGVQSVDQARAALAAFRDDGVRAVVTTPHFAGSWTRRRDSIGAVLEELDRGWARLAELAAAEFPDLEVRRGMEVRLDVPRPDLSDPRIRLAGSDAVLVEFDGFTVPLRAEEVISGLVDDGWTPLLAHPERYRGASADGMRALVDAGCRLQVNAGSLSGGHGGQVRKLAWTLLREGLVAVVASDYHGRGPLQVAEARAAVTDQLGAEAAGLLFETNPRRLLEGGAVVPAVPEETEGWIRRMKRFLDR